MATGTGLVFFDECVTRASPAGSCMLAAIQGLGAGYSIDIVCNRLEEDSIAKCRKVAIPLPRGPVLARSVLFTLLGCGTFWLRGGPKERTLKISTQGAYPFCDVCYAHCCHRLLLTRYRSQIGGGVLRRTARLLNYTWGALTERIAFRRAAMIVAPSKGLERELVSVYGSTVEGKIRILANPVDIERFRRPVDFERDTVRRSLGIPADALLFSFCALGNFELKGLRLALEAFSLLGEDLAKLVVIGGKKSEISEYEGVAKRLGVADQVRFAGLQTDIRSFLWASDAFLFPSAYETFPLVCLQAAAAGLPLLTTHLHGVEEFVADGETGWIMERNAESIRAALLGALENSSVLPQMGETARARVSRYSVKKFQARWRALIADVMASS